MATAIPAGALKSVVSEGLAEDEYLNALKNITSALESRSNKNYNPELLAIAQGMLAPSPTGHFGYGLGAAAGNVLKVKQQEAEEGLENAKMRLQLATAGKEQSNKSRAMGMAASMLGTDPAKLSENLQSGNMPFGTFSKIDPSMVTAISMIDKNVGEALKNGYMMDAEKGKFILDLYKAGKDRAELIAKFGQGVEELLPPMPYKPAGSAPQATETPEPGKPTPGKPEPTSQATPVEVPPNLPPREKAAFQIISQELQGVQAKLDVTADPTQRERLQADAEALRRELADIAKTKAPAVVTDKKKDEDWLAGLPLELQNKLREQFAKEASAPFSEKRKQIYAFDPQTLAGQETRLRELYSTVQAHPDVVGLLVKQGFLTALGAAMQKGSQTPWGTWSLPVTEFMNKLKLSPEKQTIATRVAQLTAEQFFDNGRVNKSVLGPSISNADVMLLKSPIATPEDSAPAIQYWIKHQILGNKQKSDLYTALMDFDQSRGVKASPAEFFNPKKNLQYDQIVKKYQSLSDQLVQDHSPAFQGRR